MKWDLTYHFKTEEDFKKEFEEVQALIQKLPAYQGKLSDPQSFKEYYNIVEEIETKGSKVYQYASLRSDLNKKDVDNAAALNNCQMMFYMLAELTSFEEPELLALGKEKVMSLIDQDPSLEQFRFAMEKLFRLEEHVLDAKSEKLLSIYGPLTSTGSELYSALAVGDGKAKEITLENGEKVQVTQGNYRSLIESSTCASDRKAIFEAVFEYYAEHKTTFAGIYNAVLQSDVSYMKAKNYSSSVEAHLYRNNIPVEVYKNLVDVAGDNTEAVKKYIKLRQKYLGLEEYHTYDRFLTLGSSSKKYTFEEAKELFFKSIESFPETFKEKAHEVLADGFVDVFEQPGKRTGAYSSSVTNLHPFILLNYDSTLDSVFTVAHEAGHSIHSMFSAEAQPPMLQDYTIFVAEIASTFNEHNLLDYFLASNASKEEKIVVIEKAIDNIMGTFYRQTLFAEYELLAHEVKESNKPINSQVLSNIMIELYKKYYDLDITKEGVKQYVWAYIPHLHYTPFYVYQYATSFAASFKIYKNVKEEGTPAFEKYLGLLKSGGSKYPVEQAKDAGVDFMEKETFMAVVERMNVLVDELEKLLAE